MGLDMYLYSYGEEGKRDRVLPELWISWRKANAIHWWFVTEIQGGVDLCEEHPVQREKLVELMELCNEAASLHWIELQNSYRQCRDRFSAQFHMTIIIIGCSRTLLRG